MILTLLMPIQPEPASRIYSGRKWYELRKSAPPSSGFVYLYETRDHTANVSAFRGGFFFQRFLDLPLRELWARVGERATSFERFSNYYGQRRTRGIALVIERVEILEQQVTVEQLREIDSSFSLPRWPWTYMIAKESPALRYLDSRPRQKVFVLNHSKTGADGPLNSEELEVVPLSSGSNCQLITELYDGFVKPNYPETEDYIQRVIEIHNSEFDPYGYFTRRKKVWVFVKEGKSVGFTVVTEKRGGSIKFGPTSLKQEYRGKGLASRFRLLTEKQYPDARKCYNTLPETNLAALRYVLRASYRVEAHLQSQYKIHGGELVVGKLLKPRTKPPATLTARSFSGSLQIRDAKDMSNTDFANEVQRLLSPWYDEVDEGYVLGLLAGMHNELDLSKKTKRVGIAFKSNNPIGIVVVTPKRGGALKCSPLIVEANDPEVVPELLNFAYSAFSRRQTHKYYVHMPLPLWRTSHVLLSSGFSPEGILVEPYRPGIDILILGRILK